MLASVETDGSVHMTDQRIFDLTEGESAPERLKWLYDGFIEGAEVTIERVRMRRWMAMVRLPGSGRSFPRRRSFCPGAAAEGPSTTPGPTTSFNIRSTPLWTPCPSASCSRWSTAWKTPIEAFDDADPEIDLEDNPRVKALAKKVRTSVDENGKPVSKMRMYQFRDGLFEAMLHRFKTDPDDGPLWG